MPEIKSRISGSKPTGSCLLNGASHQQPSEFEYYLQKYPGQKYDVYQQCQQILGLDSAYCGVSTILINFIGSPSNSVVRVFFFRVVSMTHISAVKCSATILGSESAILMLNKEQLMEQPVEMENGA